MDLTMVTTEIMGGITEILDGIMVIMEIVDGTMEILDAMGGDVVEILEISMTAVTQRTVKATRIPAELISMDEYFSDDPYIIFLENIGKKEYLLLLLLLLSFLF